jgi:hypothetical protein
MKKVYKNDQTDSTIKFREYSVARFPDAQTKQDNWRTLTDLTAQCSLITYKQVCEGFVGSPLHDDLLQPYFDLYYQELPKMMTSPTFSP